MYSSTSTNPIKQGCNTKHEQVVPVHLMLLNRLAISVQRVTANLTLPTQRTDVLIVKWMVHDVLHSLRILWPEFDLCLKLLAAWAKMTEINWAQRITVIDFLQLTL